MVEQWHTLIYINPNNTKSCYGFKDDTPMSIKKSHCGRLLSWHDPGIVNWSRACRDYVKDCSKLGKAVKWVCPGILEYK